MNKVLLITTHPALGGAQKWTYNQIEILSGNYEVYLATGEKEWLTEVSTPLCKGLLIDEGIYSFHSLGYLWRLYRFVKEHHIEMIIASSANAGLYARLLKFFSPFLIVIYVSHGWSAIYRGSRFHEYIEKGLSYVSNSILAISHSDYAKAVKVLGIAPKKVKLIENGIWPCIDTWGIAKKKEKDYDLEIVMVARFEVPKRQDIVIEAAKQLPNIHFHFVGDGEQRNSLQQDAPENIIFWGTQDDIQVHLKQADIFMLLSDSEGMPLSVLEALSCSKPLILSHIDSMQYFIVNNGYLVENNVDDVVVLLQKMLDKDLEVMGKHSKKIFDTRFNLEIKKEQYLAYYEGFLKSS